MLDYKLFSQGMVRLNNFFKKIDTSEIFLKDYYKAIQELNETQFNRTIEFLIKTYVPTFQQPYPLPAEFLKAVQETREKIAITPKSNQIEPNYINCPLEIKKQIQETMEKLERKTIKAW